MEQRQRHIQITSWIGIGGNLSLALIKLILGATSGSLAVIGDGIDSATDILSFMIILFAAHIISKGPDQDHPYGHHRAEALATMVIAFMIFYAGAELFRTAVSRLLTGEATNLPSTLALYATLFSIAGKILLAVYQFKIGRQTASSMLLANARNMLNDILISSGVLLGLILTYWFQAPLVDPLIAAIVSIWVVRTAITIFLENHTELMEGIEDITLYDQIFEAVKRIKNAYNPHRTRIRKLANQYIIDMDIEVPAQLSVLEGHAIALQVETEIKRSLTNVYDLSVHVEPLGNRETDEKYGVCEPEHVTGG